MNKILPLAAFLILTAGAAWADDLPGFPPLGSKPDYRMRDITEPECPNQPAFGAPAAEPGTPKDRIDRDFTAAACEKKRSRFPPSYMAPARPPVLDGGIEGGIVASDPVTQMKAMQAEAVAYSNQLAIQKKVGRVTNPWGDKQDSAAPAGGGADLFSPHVTLQSEGFRPVPLSQRPEIPGRFMKMNPVPPVGERPAQNDGFLTQNCKRTDSGRVQCTFPPSGPSQ